MNKPKIIEHPMETPCANCGGMAYYAPGLVIEHTDEIVIISYIVCLNCNVQQRHEMSMTAGVQKVFALEPMPETLIALWSKYESMAGSDKP